MINSQKHISFIALIFLSFINSFLFAQSAEWKLVSKNDSINIYTRESNDSDIKEVKITGVLACSQESIIEALEDIEKYSNWVYHCSESYQIDTIETTEYHYYSRTDMPFPFYDRDLVAYSLEWMGKDSIWYSVSIACPFKIPKVKNVIRIKKYHSKWKVKAISPSEVEFEYFISLDIGGKLPAWIINLGITLGPKKTISDLEKRSKELMKYE